MPTQTLGKVKLTPRGAYDPAATYVPLDIVSYGGGSYCVLKNVTGVTPTGDDVNYQLLAESGADGKSPQISASKTWLVWDANKGEYVDTGVSAAGEKGGEGDPGKAPIIGENGNWYEWDDASGAYTDTGKPSRGEKGNTGAEGADGADGRDGITPTIGDNGNWYLGDTDTGKPSRGADGATGATGATGEKGTDGKSAYQYAVEGGYTGTEEEFAAKLAEEMPDALPNPNALTFTGAVDGSYDGSAPLSVEIPSGCGGGGETWRLVASGEITTDDVGAIELTADDEGKPFLLRKFRFEMASKAFAAGDAYFYFNGTSLFRSGFYQSYGVRPFVLEGDFLLGKLRYICGGPINGSESVAQIFLSSSAKGAGLGAIEGNGLESFKILPKTDGTVFISGAIYKLYGVDAL